MMNEKEKIDLLTRISLDINEVKDIDILLERILTNVRLFFNADAGSIYLKENDDLKFSYSQNDTLQKREDNGRKHTEHSSCPYIPEYRAPVLPAGGSDHRPFSG